MVIVLPAASQCSNPIETISSPAIVVWGDNSTTHNDPAATNEYTTPLSLPSSCLPQLMAVKVRALFAAMSASAMLVALQKQA